MKYDIIKTENYLLVVDESEIKVGDWYYVPRTNKAYKCEYDPTELEMEKRFGVREVIAHLPLNGSPILEGVDLLPPLGDDVENIADQLSKAYSVYQTAQDDIYPGIVIGYKAAKEKYKYTERDIRFAYMQGYNRGKDNNPTHMEDYIQYLSQPKMPIGFECEIVPKKEGTIMQIPPCTLCIKPKTTTTPEGHTQWVGTYIYE